MIARVELSMTLYKSTSNVTGLDTPLQTNGIKFIEAVNSSKACTAKSTLSLPQTSVVEAAGSVYGS